MAVLAAGFHVVRPDMTPVPGAWIGSHSEWFAAADTDGFILLTEDLPDTVRIHATGFADWTGLLPAPGSLVVLVPKAVGTGETITVLASRGSLASSLPSTEILAEAELSRISSLGMDRLSAAVPGVTVREYGGSMPVVSVSLRGGEPSQADFMVDGVSIASARDGMPTGLFDPAIFSSLEVSRGGGAPGEGGTGSAGALNYLPPSGGGPLVVSVSGFTDGGCRLTGRYSRTGISLGRNMGAEGSEGFSTSMVTTFAEGGFRGGFLGGWAKGDTESPEWTLPGDGSRENAQGEGWMNWTRGMCELDVSAGSGYVGFSQNEPYPVEDTHRDLTGRLSAAWKGPVTLRAGFTSASVRSTATGRHHRNFGTLESLYSTGMLSAFAGCRIHSDETLLSGRATLSGTLRRPDASLFLSVFTDHRSPTVNDLYWPFDGSTQGNPDLVSERSSGIEGGAQWTGPVFRAGLRCFATTTGDLIIWLPDEQGIWSPSNVSSTLSRGMELTAGVSSGGFSLSGNSTWNIAEDRTEGTVRYGMLLPYRPEYTWGATAEMTVSRSLSLRGDLSGTGKRFTNRTQSEYLESYLLLDLQATARLSPGIALTAIAGNVTDTEYYMSSGYPGKGRTAGLALEYTGE